jgi:hypothetical protein
MQLTTVSEGISTCSSSSHATRCALEQPQDQACSEASVSLQQAQQQQGSDRTRNTGIGRFSLADVGSPAAQGLKIHSISLDFSLCSGTSSTSARSERQPAAAAAQAVCGPSPASGVQASPSGNLGETLDEAGGSLAALDTILCCLEALAQAVLLR